MFHCEYCEIFQKTFFYRTPPVATSVLKTHGNLKKLVASSAIHIINQEEPARMCNTSLTDAL